MCTRDTVEVEKCYSYALAAAIAQSVSQSMVDAYANVLRGYWLGCGEYAIRARAYRLSHFHMNNIGYCVSHECLSFIPIPPSEHFRGQQTVFTFSMRLALSPPVTAVLQSACRAVFSFCSASLLPTTHQTQTPNDNNNNSGDGRKHLYRVHRGLVRFAPNVERFSVFGVFWLKWTRCSILNCQQSIILTAFSFKLIFFRFIMPSSVCVCVVLRVLRFSFSCILNVRPVFVDCVDSRHPNTRVCVCSHI